MGNSPAYTEDTIVAPATPAGKGGIGIVRISGPDTATIGRQLLGELPAPRTASRKTFRDASGNAIDVGIALWFPGPASFTGEDVLELHGHGGPVLMSMLTEAVQALGARRAEPGEFSRRAFLNGKLDLSQAEAIADLIDAGSRQAVRAAHRSLQGAFSVAVNDLREHLVQLRLHVEAAIDFPEEEIDFLADEQLKARIVECSEAFDKLAAAAEQGRVLRDGVQVVIAGPPNAGKSSLYNALSGVDNAIVTELAGTTRDVLRESISIDGLPVEIVDTAGLHDSPDRIEAEGIRRATASLQNADIVLWVEDVAGAERNAEVHLPDEASRIRVRNKIDLSGEPAGLIEAEVTTVAVSALTGAGIDALRLAIRRHAGLDDHGEGSFTARERHLERLHSARGHFEQGRIALEQERAGELLAEELKLALQQLGEITGEFTSDDLLGRIFAEFCIGK